MAIIKDEELSSSGEDVIRINNGDLQALKRLQELWHLKSVEATVTFAVGILRTAQPSKRILVEPAGSDKAVPVEPSEQLLAEGKGGEEAE